MGRTKLNPSKLKELVRPHSRQISSFLGLEYLGQNFIPQPQTSDRAKRRVGYEPGRVRTRRHRNLESQENEPHNIYYLLLMIVRNISYGIPRLDV